MKIQIVLDQFELILIQIHYIQIWYIQFRKKNGHVIQIVVHQFKYLAKVNLEGLEDTSRERQHYWLLAIKTTWKAKILREQQEQQQADSRTTRETGR